MDRKQGCLLSYLPPDMGPLVGLVIRNGMPGGIKDKSTLLFCSWIFSKMNPTTYSNNENDSSLLSAFFLPDH